MTGNVVQHTLYRERFSEVLCDRRNNGKKMYNDSRNHTVVIESMLGNVSVRRVRYVHAMRCVRIYRTSGPRFNLADARPYMSWLIWY